MENKPDGLFFYSVLAVVYGVLFGILMAVFNFFSEEGTSIKSILFQSIAFGVLMSVLEYWRIHRKKKGN